MKIEHIQTDKAPAAVGPYSQGTMAGNLVFVSGSLGIDPETGKLKDDFTEQVRQALQNISAILGSAGLGMKDVVKTTVFLKDLSLFGKFNEIYRNYFGETKPARSTVEVSRLPLDAMVEIEAIAVSEA